MTRSEFRRAQKQESKKTKTFTLTQQQIDIMKDEAVTEAIKTSFILMLALPLEVLITEDYWKKSAKKKLPKFMDEVLRLYKGYESGMITLEEMEADLWEFAGIRFGENKK